ncbi:MAG: hypothetical protein E7442_09440 [Ruminococcaceae bacterium]|nr:hypothetical protein [Oscillospiraceae bacterium]
MKPTGVNRQRLGIISFLIPCGFVGNVVSGVKEEVLLFSTDGRKNIEIRMEKDCEELKGELREAIEGLSEEIIEPITKQEINGISGFSAAYRGHRIWYHETWLDLGESALRIIIRSRTDVDVIVAQAYLHELDIQLI